MVNSILLDITDTNNNPRNATIGLFDVSVNISTIGLDEMLSNMRTQKAVLRPDEVEPLIDIIEGKDDIRIIISFPKMKKDDVEFEINEGFVGILVSRNGQIYRKNIPCMVKPSEVAVTSRYNNSVLEITLKKTDCADG